MFKTNYDTDINQINNTLEKVNGVASKDDLGNVENKMPNVGGFLLTGVSN